MAARGAGAAARADAPHRRTFAAWAAHRRGDSMRDLNRRGVIGLLGGAVAWPLAARAQQVERVRRIGVLMYGDENDHDYQARLSAFMQSLAKSGWDENRNLLVDVRWTAANVDLVRRHAKELVALKPDVLVANSTPVTAAFRYETPAIPIVFVGISDPVGA